MKTPAGPLVYIGCGTILAMLVVSGNTPLAAQPPSPPPNNDTARQERSPRCPISNNRFHLYAEVAPGATGVEIRSGVCDNDFDIQTTGAGTGVKVAETTTATSVLGTIRDFVPTICPDVPAAGQHQTVELGGEAKAQIAGLLKKLGDIGITGTGKFTEEEYAGVLQQDLAAALKTSSDCRLTVFKVLQEKLLRPASDVAPSVTITGGDNVVSVGQIGGITARTVTINPPMTPELRILAKEETDGPNQTHIVMIRTEVVSPITPGLLILRLHSVGILNVTITPEEGAAIILRSIFRSEDLFSCEVPAPRGRYVITVVTQHPANMLLEASF